MSSPQPPDRKPPSLADFLLRYDLAEILREARQDYSQSSTGAPRLLEQKDITARFRQTKPRPDKPNP
jgi:hypothetical protein